VPPRRPQRRRRRRLPRLTVRRLAGILLLLVGFLYYRPLMSYVHTRDEVAQRAAEVRTLQAERRALRSGFAAASTELMLAREARQLSLVRPGERLFVISGAERWRRTHARDLR
jgi:cell division protein FtsB